MFGVAPTAILMPMSRLRRVMFWDIAAYSPVMLTTPASTAKNNAVDVIKRSCTKNRSTSSCIEATRITS